LKSIHSNIDDISSQKDTESQTTYYSYNSQMDKSGKIEINLN